MSHSTNLKAMNAARKEFGAAWKDFAAIRKQIDGTWIVELIEQAKPEAEDEIAAAAQAAGDAEANAQALEGAALDSLNLNEDDNCPHCGIHLSNGISDFAGLADLHGKKKAHEGQKHEFACMACGGEWGALVSGSKAKPWIRQSTAIKPTKLVWAIADEMMALADQAGEERPSRKEVQEECVRRGIASGTARTQYQAWKTANDNDRANAAKAAEASARLNGGN